jgi:hypothetical protein
MSVDITSASATYPYITPYGNVDDAAVGNYYSRGISVLNGGAAPFTWTATGLPAGMSIRSGSNLTQPNINPGDGEIFGTPSILGTYNVLATVTDVNGLSATQSFPLKVGQLFLYSADNLPNGTRGTAYSKTFRIVGGTGPYSTQKTGGQLPAGVAETGMTVSGTPAENGNFNAQNLFSDSGGHTFSTTSYFSIGGSTIAINQTYNLGYATINTGQSIQLTACCAAALTWSLTGGALPPGMTLSSSGLLTGAPTANGGYVFTVQAADSSNSSIFGVRQFLLNVSPLALGTSPTLPSGYVNTAYSRALTVTGNSGATTWTLLPGNYLPPGLSVSASGTLSGTPTAVGLYFFALQIADSGGNILQRTDHLTVYPASCNFVLTPQSVPVAAAGGTTNVTITANSSACGWSVTSTMASNPSSGVGSGSTTLTVPANASAAGTTLTATIGNQTFTVNQAGTAGSGGPFGVGVFQPNGAWAIDKNKNGAWDGSPADGYYSFNAGVGDIAITGDWNGDGKTKIGIYHQGFWLLDYNGNGVWDGPGGGDKFIALGGAGYLPVVGDWNGDGKTKVGFYYQGFWVLDYNGNGQWDGPAGGDRVIGLGAAGYTPVVGDWNGDGRTKVGYFNNGIWALDYNGDGVWGAGDQYFTFSAGVGDIPVVGDWNGSHTTKVGVYHQGFWLLDTNGNFQWDGVGTDTFAALGSPGYTPVVGDWSGDGKTKIGFFYNGFWALDYNGNGQWDGPAGGDKFQAIGGAAGEQPVVGKW